MVKKKLTLFFSVSPSWFYELKREIKVCSMVSFSYIFTSMKKGKSVLDKVSFSWFNEHEKYLKVISSRETKWLNSMLLCSKSVE
jgi:hypothetical protein